MPITITWSTHTINVPQDYLTPISGTLYELDVDAFRLALKDIEDSEEGMPHPTTHSHNTEVSLGGVTYARTVEILYPYTVTFQNGQYRVRLAGANNNIADVANLNQVSILSMNAAGLIVTTGGSGTGATAEEVWTYETRTLTSFGTLVATIWGNVVRSLTDKAGFLLDHVYDPAKTAAQTSEVDFVRQLLNNRQEIQNIGGLWYLVTYADDDNAILVKSPLLDHEGNPIQPDGGVPSRRGRGV